MTTTPGIGTDPTYVGSTDIKDLSLVEQIGVFMIVGGIILTFILIFACRPLAMIGVIVAFSGAGIFLLSFWRYSKKEAQQIAEDASSMESTDNIEDQASKCVCPHCGKNTGYEGNEFCPFCGNKITPK